MRVSHLSRKRRFSANSGLCQLGRSSVSSSLASQGSVVLVAFAIAECHLGVDGRRARALTGHQNIRTPYGYSHARHRHSTRHLQLIGDIETGRNAHRTLTRDCAHTIHENLRWRLAVDSLTVFAVVLGEGVVVATGTGTGWYRRRHRRRSDGALVVLLPLLLRAAYGLTGDHGARTAGLHQLPRPYAPTLHTHQTIKTETSRWWPPSMIHIAGIAASATAL
jgi:hypothetical protein